MLVSLLVWGALEACTQKAASPPPPPPQPSMVMTEGRVAFYLTGLRIPGTRQEIRARKDGANLWIPLKSISALKFQGPVHDDYRQAEVILNSGETLRLEVKSEQILEGNTDAGYWNTSLDRIDYVIMGTD